MPTKRQTMKRQTRKKQNGKVLDVRSEKHLSLFNKMVVHGPLTIPITMTFVKKQGCGPCENFHENVWSPLTKLKHRNMNLATIDSEVYDKTGLPPVSEYPTVMVIGKDKSIRPFQDEQGSPINSFPRKPTLEEDFKSLKELVTEPLTPVPNTTIRGSIKNKSNSMMRNTSPYDTTETVVPSKSNEVSLVAGEPVTDLFINKSKSAMPTSGTPPTSGMPPNMSEDVSATAVRSQVPGAPSGIAASIQLQRGGLLKAIRDQTDSLKAILKMRYKKSKKTRKHSKRH